MNNKIILDLCGGTGSWSKPYKEAGYDVRVMTLPEWNVLDWQSGSDQWHPIRELLRSGSVYGILAAPPCTMFSFARTNAKAPRDLEGAMRIVNACLGIIAEAQYNTPKGKLTSLKFWALENPFGLLRHFLGHPAMIFSPFEFGDRYQKKTCLWGYFNIPKKNPIELTGEEKYKFSLHSQKLPELPEGYVWGDSNRRAAARAVTPPMFAKAFFKANK